jgi:carbon storage regulator
MLVLTRKVGEQICIGGQIVVTVVRIQSDKVRLGFEAPADVIVHREEIYRRVRAGQAPDPDAPEPRRSRAEPGQAEQHDNCLKY